MCFELSVSTITLILLWELLFMPVSTYNKYESLSPNDQSVRSSTDRLVFRTISGKANWFKSSLLRDHEVVVFYWQLLKTVCKLIPKYSAVCRPEFLDDRADTQMKRVMIHQHKVSFKYLPVAQIYTHTCMHICMYLMYSAQRKGTYKGWANMIAKLKIQEQKSQY